MPACSNRHNHYLLVEQNLHTGNHDAADSIMAAAEKDYGTASRVLYWIDRGMVLHLAGRYEASNGWLEQADQEIDQLYTRRLRTEAKAFLTSDTELPYEGEPYEQVMINAVKALNYALLGKWNEALVEARRLDHRLNVLTDRVGNSDAYHDDAFARYLTGLLYEASGDFNNAFIAYRKSHELYRSPPWSHAAAPPMLKADLLRMTETLNLLQEHEEYRQAAAGVNWQPVSATQHLAQVVVLSYNGRAPIKEDQFIDVPISLDALNLVLLTKAATAERRSENRAIESVLYGLNGRVVRVALPRIVPQKTQVAYGQVTLSRGDELFTAKTELTQNFGALAEKALADRFKTTTLKAIARSTVKYALAEGAGRGAGAAAGKDAGPLVGLLVGVVAKTLAVASEEADKRSWRMLPDEIQIARVWVPAGTYELRLRYMARMGGEVGQSPGRTITLKPGQTMFITDRVLQ